MFVDVYSAAGEAEWDALVARSISGTFLHSRRFLAYHGDRFVDRSVVLRDDKKVAVAVLPAAVDPGDPSVVVSHPGATFGGFVHDGALRGPAMLEAVTLVRAHYQALGHTRLRYKAVPAHYHQAPAMDDLYAFFRLDARRYRCDLASCVELGRRLAVSDGRKKGLKRAQVHGVTAAWGVEYLPQLWPIVEETLARRHGAKPVHSLGELQTLIQRFPQEIRCAVAVQAGEVLGGTVLFNAPTVWHCQYIAANEKGYDLSALDVVFDEAMAEAVRAGVRSFDFGISNEEGGRVLNEGLHRFKSRFGAGGVVHEFYELDLTPSAGG